MSTAHNESMRLEFRTPITIGQGEGQVTYTHVDLVEPLAVHMERAARADTSIGQIITLVAQVSSQPRLMAEKMCRRDLNRAAAFFSGFEDGPETAADGLS